MSLTREPGQVEVGEEGMQANINTAMLYYDLVKERREDPRDDLFTRLIEAEIEREDGETTKLDDIEITGFATLLGGAGAETVTKLVGNAPVVFARYPRPVAEAARRPQQDSRRGRGTAALRGAVAIPGPPLDERRPPAWRHDPGRQADFPDQWRGQPRPRGVDRSRQVRRRTRPRPKRRTWDSATGFTVAWARRWPAWRAAIALEKLLDFMPRFEVDWERCKRVQMQNVMGWQNVPVKVLK